MKTKFLFLALTPITALMLSAMAIVFWISLAIIDVGSANAAAPKPDLTMLLVEPNDSTVNAGEMLSVADTVENQGPGDAKKFKVVYLLSTDTTPGKGDIKIGGGSSQRAGAALASGASNASGGFSIVVPQKTPPGEYYVCASVSSTPGETNKNNNTLCSTGTVEVPPPDLVISDLSTTATAESTGKTIEVNLGVVNDGGSPSKGSKVELHASTNTTYGDSDDLPLSMGPGISKLNPGQSKVFPRQKVKLPSTPGIYYICANADSRGVVTEGDEGNNALCTATQVTVTGAAAWLLFADDAGNNLTAFTAASPNPPISQLGAPLNFGSLVLGEIHFANGKVLVVVTNGLTGPASCTAPGCGGIIVIDAANPGAIETTITLESTSTGRASRIVHAYVDPEGQFLWANNDGPSGNTEADSVFRINVDPASTDYLDYVDILVGNGHKKSAISRPSPAHPDAKRLFFNSDLTAQRVNVIDDDPSSTTYGQVIKIVRNVGSSPHGMDYSPAGGRAFAGITGGGVVSVDATQLDEDSDEDIDFPDVDCAGIVDDYCVETGTTNPDPSVYKLSTGAGSNMDLRAGYVHTHSDGATDTVYTGGRNGTVSMGWLTAIDPGSGTIPPSTITAIDLGNQSAGSFDFGPDNKIYVPSSGTSAPPPAPPMINDKIKVIDATTNTLLPDITVGVSSGENRNGEVSPDGRLLMYPNGTEGTASVIDTETDEVIDTVELSGDAKNVGMIKLPFDTQDNH